MFGQSLKRFFEIYPNINEGNKREIESLMKKFPKTDMNMKNKLNTNMRKLRLAYF